MATITLTTTGPQDAILARLLVGMNADRTAKQLAPYADVPAMVRGILVDAVKSWRAQQDEEDRRSVGEAYNTASGAVQANVRTLLGL